MSTTQEKRIFPWMSYSKFALGFSLTLVLLSLGALFSKGLNLGLDFTGGIALELKVPADVSAQNIRDELKGSEFDKAAVQGFGGLEDIIIRIPGKIANIAQADTASVEKNPTPNALLLAKLHKKWPAIAEQSSSFIGPAVGDELRDKSGIAMLFAILMMLAYIWFRFSIKFGIGAFVALAHDVIITMGFFAVTGLTVDLSVLAAVLAVVGYSINDTVVISDRIRENFTELRSAEPTQVIDTSISETIDRTLMTSITTLVVLVVLFLLGGESLRGFSAALIVGVFIGTYSSVYVASSIILGLKTTKEDFIQKSRQELLDDSP